MSPLPPPGWYADPERPHTWRYWDGQTWTNHRASMAAPLAAPTPSRHRITTPARILLAFGAILGTGMAGTVAIALAVGPTSVSTDAPSTRATGATTPAASAAVTPAATPSAAAVPAPSRPTTPATPAPATAPKKAGAAAAGLLAVAGIVDGDTIKVHLKGTTERVRVIGIIH